MCGTATTRRLEICDGSRQNGPATCCESEEAIFVHANIQHAGGQVGRQVGGRAGRQVGGRVRVRNADATGCQYMNIHATDDWSSQRETDET
jgi:hypothetical protein